MSEKVKTTKLANSDAKEAFLKYAWISEGKYIIWRVKKMKEQLKNVVAVAGVFCRNPGSNQGPLDLQSNALPTELFRLPGNF